MPTRVATYLDANSGAPLHPEVVKALLPLLTEEGTSRFANPSSLHSQGRQARRLISESQNSLFESLGLPKGPTSLSASWVFTSSGSEANQQAIRSVLESRLLAGQPVHWITSAVEHDSVLQLHDWVRERGGEVDVLPVDSEGRLVLDALTSLIRPTTALISALWVNNETGVITDVERLEREVARLNPGTVLHVDAAQAWGKLPFRLGEWLSHGRGMPDFLTFSGHKIGAPAGVGGVLRLGRKGAVRSKCGLTPLILGKQQNGWRGGTENLLGVVALGAAARALRPDELRPVWESLRDRLQNAISLRIPGVLINGAAAPRVPNTLSLCFEGGLGGEVRSDALVAALDLEGFSVSAGSACSSGSLEPSHVLMAMGRSREQARASLRVSFCERAPDWERLERFVEVLEKTVARLRGSGSDKDRIVR